MPDNFNAMSPLRVNKLMRALQDRRGVPQKLSYLSRTPIIPASDGEIMARFMGQVLIADLIADGQRAGIYSLGKMAFESTSVPNLKLGNALNQEQLNQLKAFRENVNVQDDLFPMTEARIIDNLRIGVMQRMEALCVAVRIGGFSYDRLGIKMSDVGFGMPSDLKITPVDEWTDTTNGKPVTDISFAKRLASVKYGINYNRAVMSLAAFNAMIATTEFQNKMKPFIRQDLGFSNLDGANTEFQRNLATNVLGLQEIELKDDRYWTEGVEGGIKSAPFQPINKVVLESSQSDNDASVIDFANGIVTESIVAQNPSSPLYGQLPANARGPVGYMVSEHNPPSETYYGVGRGFTRRHYHQATAVLTIAPDNGTGSLEETVDFEEIPFS